MFELKLSRPEALLIFVNVPGERWEIEVFADGHTEFERFLSDETITDEKTLEHLFSKFGHRARLGSVDSETRQHMVHGFPSQP